MATDLICEDNVALECAHVGKFFDRDRVCYAVAILSLEGLAEPYPSNFVVSRQCCVRRSSCNVGFAG